MEKELSEFSSALFLIQCLSFIILLFVIYLIYKIYKKVK